MGFRVLGLWDFRILEFRAYFAGLGFRVLGLWDFTVSGFHSRIGNGTLCFCCTIL